MPVPSPKELDNQISRYFRRDVMGQNCFMLRSGDSTLLESMSLDKAREYEKDGWKIVRGLGDLKFQSLKLMLVVLKWEKKK